MKIIETVIKSFIVFAPILLVFYIAWSITESSLNIRRWTDVRTDNFCFIMCIIYILSMLVAAADVYD